MMNDILFKGLVEKTGKWSELAKSLKEVQLTIKSAKLIEDELKAALVDLCEGVGCYDSNGYVYKPTLVKGSIQYNLIKQLEGLDLEPFRKESTERWSLSVLKAK